ncbi:hypothetical protein L1887_19904 [Cichorium endivia]|nr:hypothetical protein L1887_19904 [Cichorium endivia]
MRLSVSRLSTLEKQLWSVAEGVSIRGLCCCSTSVDPKRRSYRCNAKCTYRSKVSRSGMRTAIWSHFYPRCTRVSTGSMGARHALFMSGAWAQA